MSHHEVHRIVAKQTGEDLSTIFQRGFSVETVLHDDDQASAWLAQHEQQRTQS